VRSLFSTNWLQDLRRAGTQTAIRSVLAASHRLSPTAMLQLGATMGELARWTVPLRRRLAANYRLAGIEPTRERIDRYFAHFGRYAGWSMAVYQAGFEKAGMVERFPFDDSVANLDRAVAAGKGVILSAPHVFCHEIGAAALNRWHPLAMISRESKSPARTAMKQHWCEATGLETVRRPRHVSVVADTRTYLRVLRAGRILAITPDLVANQGKGVPMKAFGRDMHLAPGVAVLAMWSGAPIVNIFGKFDKDCIRLSFSEPEYVTAGSDKNAAIREAMARTWGRLEDYLTAAPENWMFWLDKRWARALRGAA
jgi:lauroyl/myristoyl acyltransferase